MTGPRPEASSASQPPGRGTGGCLAHGHCDLGDLHRRDLGLCTYDQIENSGFVLVALVVSAALAALPLVLSDGLGPLRSGRPAAPRLLTLPAILLPYAAYAALGG
ncbi:hypothetical protein [Streptomyces sp. NPDC048481]|uniref:hypothetical protein n=1 Tax=Streptomyces sp. NPDC048481 TaxID=3365557 RepID=UPI003716E375